jgi:ATP-binding protein involved in chromosome partitioning
MIDPRLSVIERRLSAIKRILVFSSGKGGVGKSICSSVASLILAREGQRIGLLDLDFHGASTHVFLGATLRFPEESRGLIPLSVREGLEFMSIAAFTGEKAVPLRGNGVSNALIELLTVTIWGELDYLIVDMPPGIGDEVLDLIRLMGRSEVVVISTPSVVSLRVVERLLRMFLEIEVKVRGIIENMCPQNRVSDLQTEVVEELGIDHLGAIPYYPDLEGAIGSPDKLLSSHFGSTLAKILAALEK